MLTASEESVVSAGGERRRPPARLQMTEEHSIGLHHPLGATILDGGVNFCVFARHADYLELVFFEEADDREPSRVIRLDPRLNRTHHYWHVFVPGVEAGQIYGWRAHGPFDPQRGYRFDGQKLLIDPYARAIVVPKAYNRREACISGDNTPHAMRSVVVDMEAYDWEGDQPLELPFRKTVIYELHVKGFTRHPNSGVAPDTRGTFRGLIEKIPYLQELGVTAVELMPVFHFDEQDGPTGLTNYWGYSPISFFALHSGYSSDKSAMGPLNEFRDMVKALHRAGMEVILDVVYNHSGEGDHDGPTMSLKGLANSTYYHLESDQRLYGNYAGTGNTLSANHAVVRRLILDSLRFWVTEMHVDGFRFDLASVLSRDEDGNPVERPPILWDIQSDPELAGAKIIAEAWDAAGLYQVGTFSGERWKEWNGRFRDDIRSFVRGDNGAVAHVIQRVLASPDIYGHQDREPEQSINFVTCHDGFTMNDLVSYNTKYNLANRESNRDGHNHNLSWNCGHEGPSSDPEIERLRNRQVKNFFFLNLMALGVPMLLMGDEMRRTQGGNNNAYCQDNEISWVDWSLLETHKDIHRFVRMMIQLRSHFDVYREDTQISLRELAERSRIEWHGVHLDQPDWTDESHSFACTIWGYQERYVMYLAINSFHSPLWFELPDIHELGGESWKRVVDTNLPSPYDIQLEDQVPFLSKNYAVQGRSAIMLMEHIDGVV